MATAGNVFACMVEQNARIKCKRCARGNASVVMRMIDRLGCVNILNFSSVV